jgi:hypothetical protein
MVDFYQKNLPWSITFFPQTHLDIYIEGTIPLEEYQPKKENFTNEKKELEENLRDFAAGGNNWFELYSKRAPLVFFGGRYLPPLP